MTCMTRCLAALTGLLFLAAAVQTAEAQAEPEMQSASVPPFSFHEDCLELEAGQVIDYPFSSSEGLAFNIHYHVGDDIIFVEEEEAVAAGDGRMTAPVDHGYCLMWENQTAEAVELRYRFGLAEE